MPFKKEKQCSNLVIVLHLLTYYYLYKMRNLIMSDRSIFFLQKEAWEDIGEYIEDYRQIVHQREKKRVPILLQSTQISYRPKLLKYLKEVCHENKLTHCCLHLAVYLLDIFMDNHRIRPDKLLVLSNVCLLLAAKFEENASTTPKIKDLYSKVKHYYTKQDYNDLELFVLKFFQWFIMFPTAAHYVYFYIHVILSLDDLTENKRLRSLFYVLHGYITQYLDNVIDDIHYEICYTPAKVAAAIISASRIKIGLSRWNTQLEKVTGFTHADIQMPLHRLLSL